MWRRVCETGVGKKEVEIMFEIIWKHYLFIILSINNSSKGCVKCL